ncbi:hypothetical protein BP5796_02829 [Coleophoma crateriformis]|uniref:DNA2/NAM7 helicase-like C-terminal domain-containing protein n=1 Tax=Coleophoma crateriformis TaxID=565419 RepID=A0A3D8SZE4_9HELO|nr:hypothetical protein BP5796_02829 [Coleophoma crateriformis]
MGSRAPANDRPEASPTDLFRSTASAGDESADSTTKALSAKASLDANAPTIIPALKLEDAQGTEDAPEKTDNPIPEAPSTDELDPTTIPLPETYSSESWDKGEVDKGLDEQLEEATKIQLPEAKPYEGLTQEQTQEKLREEAIAKRVNPINHLIHVKGGATATVTLRFPQFQRATMVIRVRAPRNIEAKDNPGRVPYYNLYFELPASGISKMEYEEIHSSSDLSAFLSYYHKSQGFTDLSNNILEFAKLNVQFSTVFVLFAKVPELASLATQTQLQRFVKLFLGKPVSDEHSIELIVRRYKNVFENDVNDFKKAIVYKRTNDPFKSWIEDSPRKETITMGNLVAIRKRPPIPVQRAVLVAYNIKSYMIPQIYYAAYEDEYARALTCAFTNLDLPFRAIQLPTAMQPLYVPEDPNAGPFDESLTKDLQEPYIKDMRGTAPFYNSGQNKVVAEVYEEPGTDWEKGSPENKGEQKKISEPEVELDGEKPTRSKAKRHERIKINSDNDESEDETSKYPLYPEATPQEAAKKIATKADADKEVNKPNKTKKDTKPDNTKTDTKPDKTKEDTTPDKTKTKPNPSKAPAKKRTKIDSDDEDSDDKDSNTGVKKDPGNTKAIHTKSKDLFDDDDERDRAQVVDPFPWLKSTGHISVILERRLASPWKANDPKRPYVDLKLPCLNYKACTSMEALAYKFSEMPWITVNVQTDHSNQSFKDDVRVINELFASKSLDKQRFAQSLLCQQIESSPLERINVEELHGTSIIANTARASYNESQIDMGPYGTGKSHVAVTESVIAISNPETHVQVAYAMDTNFGVDDVATRIHDLTTRMGLKKKVIRLHSLKSEKAAVYRKLGSTATHPEKRFQEVSESLLSEVASAQFIHDISTKYTDRRKASDPRRVLESMSLAQAMVDNMNRSCQLGQRSALNLRAALTLYAKEGYEKTQAADRKKIKEDLGILLRTTLQSADALVGTYAVFAKQTVIDNINPKIFVVDEAARCSEIRSLTPKNQGLLSLLEHQILVGAETYMLREQHRCLGNISRWPSKEFYHGRVIQAPYGAEQQAHVTAARRFVADILECPKKTNRAVVNVSGSKSRKEEGGVSSINTDHLESMMYDLHHILAHEPFNEYKIMIISFYKAQANLIRQRISELATDRHIEVRTVNTAQGYESDIVLIHTVRTKGPKFIGNPNRMNTAFTRAKYLQLVYVDYGILDGIKHPENSEHTKHLKAFLDDCSIKEHVIDRVAASIFYSMCSQPGHKARDCPTKDDNFCNRCRD